MNSLKYIVANHIFHITLPENDELHTMQHAYEPFSCSQVSFSRPLFNLTIKESYEFASSVELIGRIDGDTAVFDIARLANGGYSIKISPVGNEVCATLQLSEDFKEAVGVFSGNLRHRYFAYVNSTMLLFALASAPLYTIMMHASVVRKDGAGYLFMAKSGTGKSTHSRLWLENIDGCELLNDDNPIVRVNESGDVLVYGSPWSGKTHCYKNASAQVGAFVKLHQAAENTIEGKRNIHAFAVLLPSCSSLQWNKKLHHCVCDTISEIISSTKVYALGCRPDKDAAVLCYNTIKK